MLQVQMKSLNRKRELEKFKSINIDIKILNKSIKEFILNVPFTLTNDQQSVIDEILRDLVRPSPMYRLLQGDVGSGKTVIAAAAAQATIDNGYNVIIMSPTTILANQTFKAFKKFMPATKIELITSTTQKIPCTTPKKDTKSLKQRKEATIYIGTHALLYQNERDTTNIGLVIIDEQHRFGVEQRQQLINIAGDIKPNYLVMTATPIPRTMMLALFGDMQTSILYSKPKGRKDVLTYLVPQEKKEDAFIWINNKIKEGEQVFWICPLIEDSDKSNLKSIEVVYKELSSNIKYPVQILHGKIKEEIKNSILDDFKNQKFNVLLATTVVEVGIDIPNANIIVIESSEQFGLAQLHQLRGRVGRNKNQGYCFLFLNNEDNIKAKTRLEFFTKEKDGLKISEFDLKNRGPGEVYGTIQSGIPNLKIANIYDIDLIQKTRSAATKILKIEI